MEFVHQFQIDQSLNLSIYISLEKLTCACMGLDWMRMIQGPCDLHTHTHTPTPHLCLCHTWFCTLVQNHPRWWTKLCGITTCRNRCHMSSTKITGHQCCGKRMVSLWLACMSGGMSFSLPSVCLSLHPLTGVGGGSRSKGSRSLSFPLSLETGITNSFHDFPKPQWGRNSQTLKELLFQQFSTNYADVFGESAGTVLQTTFTCCQ